MGQHKIAAVLGLAAVLGFVHWSTPAAAQFSMPSMPSMPSVPSLGGASLPSVSSASPTNLAGIIQYCAQNNYLGSGSTGEASSVQSGLLSKFTGSSTAPTSDSAYSAGSSGELDTGNGQTTSLGGTGLKAEMTQKVCGEVLSHAKSML